MMLSESKEAPGFLPDPVCAGVLEEGERVSEAPHRARLAVGRTLVLRRAGKGLRGRSGEGELCSCVLRF